MKRLNRFFYLLLLSAAFAACSDDDGPKTPPVEYDVISFEPAEGMLDAVTGQEVKLGEVKMSLMGLGDYTYPKVYCAKAYATTADLMASSLPQPTGIWLFIPITLRHMTAGVVSDSRRCTI